MDFGSILQSHYDNPSITLPLLDLGQYSNNSGILPTQETATTEKENIEISSS